MTPTDPHHNAGAIRAMFADHPTIALNPVPGHPDYLVSRLGGVFSTHNRDHLARPLKPWVDTKGYLKVTLVSDVRRFVHHLILETYIGPCPAGMECLHGPGGKLDNSISNLRWGTPVENAADRERDGTVARGPKNGNAKLSDKDILEIKTMKGIDASRKYGISEGQASRIKSGKRWRHIR